MYTQLSGSSTDLENILRIDEAKPSTRGLEVVQSLGIFCNRLGGLADREKKRYKTCILTCRMSPCAVKTTASRPSSVRGTYNGAGV